MTGGKWKKHHEPEFLRNEKRVIEERLQQIFQCREQEDLRQRIGPPHSGGFQPQTRRSKHRTGSTFLGNGPPTPARQKNMPGPSSASTGPKQFAPMPMDEGEIDSETDQIRSNLDVPAWTPLRRSKERPICKKTANRAKKHSTRRIKLGPRTGHKRNRKEFPNGPATNND